ncbi:MAG: transglutaminase-like domain-containing protein [Nitrospirota bacterium]|nr:transglutaminase-like domain-containing protein [Nitrospirota bacterium]
MNFGAPDTETAVDHTRIAHLIALLGDDDPDVAETITTHLREIGPVALPALQAAEKEASPPLKGRAATLIRELLEAQLLEELRAFGREGCPNLEEGLYLLARLHTPNLDPTVCTRSLTRMTEDLMVRLDPGEGVAGMVSCFSRYLYGELGFHGNLSDYYNPDNSYLNTLLITRAGIPISLSALYLVLTRRLGLAVTGAGLPGHFLVCFNEGNRRWVIDPFHRGRVLDREGCEDLLRGIGLSYEERYLDPVDNRYILERSLKNLISIYSERNEPEALERHQKAMDALRGKE